MKYTVITRDLLSSLKFRTFTKNDYYGFSGVESPVPLIAENEDEGICVVIDGDTAELYCFDGDGSFDIVDVCENIRELPVKSARDVAIEAEIKKMEEAIATLKNELCYGE
jgi:hypothetical protein